MTNSYLMWGIILIAQRLLRLPPFIQGRFALGPFQDSLFIGTMTTTPEPDNCLINAPQPSFFKLQAYNLATSPPRIFDRFFHSILYRNLSVLLYQRMRHRVTK